MDRLTVGDQPRRPACFGQRPGEWRPFGARRHFRFGQEGQVDQRIVQLVGVARLGPHFVAHAGDGVKVQLAEIRRRIRIQPAPRHHGLRAPLFQRCIIQIGVGPRGEDFQRQRRRFRKVAGDHLYGAALDVGQQSFKPVHVHGLVQAVGDRLSNERMIGNLPVADDVLAAGHLVGEDGGEQVFGGHALQLRRDLVAAAKAQQGERDAGVPAPAGGEHGRIQQRLGEQGPHGFRRQITGYVLQRKAVAGGKRQHDGVFRGRGLQLEVELAAETLAQAETPGAVDSPTEGRMNHELHAA